MILVFLHKYNNTPCLILIFVLYYLLMMVRYKTRSHCTVFRVCIFLYYIWVSHFVYDRDPIQNCFGFRHVEETAAIIETLGKLVSHTEIKAKVIVKKKRGVGWGRGYSEVALDCIVDYSTALFLFVDSLNYSLHVTIVDTMHYWTVLQFYSTLS